MTQSSNEGLTLAEVDSDGALREAADRVGGSTRSAFFGKAGAVMGTGLLAGAIPVALSRAQGGLPKSDIEILNFALTLEYLEAAFYREANAGGALNGEVATFSRITGGHEDAHVQALLKTLGSQAVKKPSFDFKGTTKDEKKFVATAILLEDTGVAAYGGQAPRIKTPAVLAAAGSILPVEARHAAWIRDINTRAEGALPAPEAFEPAKSMDEILDAVKETGFIKS